MNIDDELTPGEKHAAFARDIVACARAHGMSGLSLTFRANFSTLFPVGCPPSKVYSGLVTMTWREGRHGAKEDIKLRFDGSMTVPEGSDHAE